MKSYAPPKPFLLLPLLSLTLFLTPVVFADDAPPRGGLQPRFIALKSQAWTMSFAA
ncbi:hypothetical protein [Nitrincola nitratireducens]|uniref:Uncharacterized protein n=1 Tax=Nitrincola nitratireducens TaxID=1229521 RepID=W9USZ7_9GAMM|nr:hypothetical protein [Nitrincola nitratireducens]EXJ10229.1 hypothetical protein D791_02787 [Nitrincola nitratireducens]